MRIANTMKSIHESSPHWHSKSALSKEVKKLFKASVYFKKCVADSLRPHNHA